MYHKINIKLTKAYYIIRESLKFLLFSHKKFILIEGYPESANFGDALNSRLALFLSDKEKVLYPKFVRVLKSKLAKLPSYAIIGSVVQSVRPNSLIWGAGIIRQDIQHLPKPNKIYAIRGPKSREILLKSNVDCPEIYGDPALLLPLIYFPEVDKTHKVGVIPHYTDLNSDWIKKVSTDIDVLIIDLEVGLNFEIIIDQLLSCKSIITSSLHGLIIAYAYGIPVCHIKLSDNLVGGNFKFHDFLLSVGKKPVNPIDVSNDVTIKQLLEFMDTDKMIFDFEELITSCPFITEEKKDLLLLRNSTIKSKQSMSTSV